MDESGPLPPATSTPPMPPPLDTTGGPQETTTGLAPTTIMTEPEPSSSGASTGDTPSTGGDGCDDEGLYRARWTPGGLDRVVLFRRDDVGGTCTWITLAQPLESSPYDVPPSGGWAVEQAFSNDVPSSCDGDAPSMDGAEALADLHGSIVVDRGVRGSACEVAVTAIAFLADEPRGPQQVNMCPEPVEIEGC